MYAAAYLGGLVDECFNLEKPIATMLFVVLALILVMLSIIKQLEKLNKG